MVEADILYLLKHGQASKIPSISQDIQKQDYPRDFVVFMDIMLKKYHLKRKDVAQRAGLSPDYTYKLLNGQKKTNERDYILAICIATGMNYSETQWALDIYSMPMLSSSNLRSHIIAYCIRVGQDIDEINDILESHNFNPIKVSPDMKSSEFRRIKDNRLPVESDIDISEYKEISRMIEAEKCGNAPMDYSYWGVLKISNGKTAYYVEAAYSELGDQFDVMTEEMHDLFEKKAKEYNQVIETDIDDLDVLNLSDPSEGIDVVEHYDSLIEAARSPFFKWYLEIDRAVDDKVLKTLNSVDDTRNNKPRFGAKLGDKNWIYYMEAFNTEEPEKREYFQIIKDGDEYTYSISHESYFMRIELGNLYDIYFREKSHPEEYFIKVHDLTELKGNSVRYGMIFKNLQLLLHQFIHQNFDFESSISEETLIEDQIEALLRQAAMCMRSGDTEGSIESNRAAYDLMKTSKKDMLAGKIVTAYKLSCCYDQIGKKEEAKQWENECLSFKDFLKDQLVSEPNKELFGSAPVTTAILLNKKGRDLYKAGDTDGCLKTMQEAVAFCEGTCYDPDDWCQYANCVINYSVAMEAVNMEKALELLEEALSIVEEHDLDKEPDSQHVVFLLYNNLAWVLWNEFSSEEAIIYYSKAIDVIEKFMRVNKNDPVLSMSELIKELGRLYEIYLATSKVREADRLKKKYAKRGITIEYNL